MKVGDTITLACRGISVRKTIAQIWENTGGLGTVYIVFTDGTNYKSWTDWNTEIEAHI